MALAAAQNQFPEVTALTPGWHLDPGDCVTIRCLSVSLRAALVAAACFVFSSGAAVLAAQTPAGRPVPPPAADTGASLAEARRIIAAGNVAWGRIRVGYDRAAADTMLAPDFWVQIRDRRMTRAEFLDAVMQRGATRLVRFDASVLTVRRTPDGWVALILEKLEYEGTGRDGRPQRAAALWVTRDGWRQAGSRWVVSFSEAIEWEQWLNQRPPLTDW